MSICNECLYFISKGETKTLRYLRSNLNNLEWLEQLDGVSGGDCNNIENLFLLLFEPKVRVIERPVLSSMPSCRHFIPKFSR